MNKLSADDQKALELVTSQVEAGIRLYQKSLKDYAEKIKVPYVPVAVVDECADIIVNSYRKGAMAGAEEATKSVDAHDDLAAK